MTRRLLVLGSCGGWPRADLACFAARFRGLRWNRAQHRGSALQDRGLHRPNACSAATTGAPKRSWPTPCHSMLALELCLALGTTSDLIRREHPLYRQVAEAGGVR